MIRKILFPVVPIYWMVTWLRNVCYDAGVFKSKSYGFPIVCVGNLSVGGTGKTPMIEYLIRLLKEDYLVGTLSRGYGRKTKGFLLADGTATAKSIGDEPYQFYKKFQDIMVGVDANRQHGIVKLQSLKNPDVILLDDAFQHRKVTAGLNILLTSYGKLYSDDICLPTGDLREPKSGSRRADIIVVTKCPDNITQEQRDAIKVKLRLRANQELFFSTIDYNDVLYSEHGTIDLSTLKQTNFALVTGIANPKPLVDFLTEKGYRFEHFNFKDHHVFSDKDIKMLQLKDLIVTTEKDFMRLEGKISSSKLFYLPIRAHIFEHEKFNGLIRRFCNSY